MSKKTCILSSSQLKGYFLSCPWVDSDYPHCIEWTDLSSWGKLLTLVHSQTCPLSLRDIRNGAGRRRPRDTPISYPESSGFLVSGATPERLWGHRILLPQDFCGKTMETVTEQPIKKIEFFRCPQSLPGVAQLTKKPEDSGYEIGDTRAKYFINHGACPWVFASLPPSWISRKSWGSTSCTPAKLSHKCTLLILDPCI